MFTLTVLLIAILSTVTAVDFTVGAEFETSKFKALGEFYRDDPLLETDTFIMHTDMGTKYFTLESATKGAIDPDNFNNVFNAINGQIGDLHKAMKRNAIMAKTIFTGEGTRKRVKALIQKLIPFKPFDPESVLRAPRTSRELKNIYERFAKVSTFWNDDVKLDFMDYDLEECNLKFVYSKMKKMKDEPESQEAFERCGAKLNAIHLSLNRSLKMLADFLVVYRRGLREHNPNDAVVDRNAPAPSLFTLIQKGHIAWTSRAVHNTDKEPRTALMRYLCYDCPDNFGIKDESPDTVKATAHHTIGLKLAKVPQLFQYYQSGTFLESFNSFEGDEEVKTIVGNMSGAMFINPQRLKKNLHRERVRAMVTNLGVDLQGPSPTWNEEVLMKYLKITEDDEQIQECDKGQDAVGLNLLFLSYAINAFIGNIADDALTDDQLNAYSYGPKKTLKLMSRVSFRKLYMGLGDCQPIFRNFFAALCHNNACDAIRLVAYQDEVELINDPDYDTEMKDFRGEQYQITLRQWYDSIINGINVEDEELENSKLEMCSLKRGAPRTSIDFNAFFDCEQTDLLSPTEPAASFVTKQALNDYFTNLLTTENPVKLATLNSYMSKQHTSMGGYRNVEAGWVILENRAVAHGLPLSKSGRFADEHFKGIKKYVIERDHFEDDDSDDNQEMHFSDGDDVHENADHQMNAANDVNPNLNQLII